MKHYLFQINGRFAFVLVVWRPKIIVIVKTPAIVYLERVDTRDHFDFSGLPDELDSSILSRDTSISM
jgi:hypothetical protein